MSMWFTRRKIEMKKTPETKPDKVEEMASEYRFDYKKAKLYRFAEKMESEPLVVMIEPDIAKSSKRLSRLIGIASIDLYNTRERNKISWKVN